MSKIPVVSGVQRRSVSANLRTSGATDEFALVGYAALYNSLSKNFGGFREMIAPGTFQRSINRGADVKALFNHQPDNILGRTKSGTLHLESDSRGLKFRCDLDKRQSRHQDLHAAVQRGDVDECSFAFTVARGGEDWMENGCEDDDTGEKCYMRTLKDVDLMDVSVVTYPAYDGTSAGARAQMRSRADYSAETITWTGSTPSSFDPHKMTYIRLIQHHPTLGAMGTYTAVEASEAESLVERGWAKFDRP